MPDLDQLFTVPTTTSCQIDTNLVMENDESTYPSNIPQLTQQRCAVTNILRPRIFVCFFFYKKNLSACLWNAMLTHELKLGSTI
uniref:Putative ovule protein n=1 Tax=Solanum chacoense TaxID=4108 RepID=A0A0V0GSL9_SOLCH